MASETNTNATDFISEAASIVDRLQVLDTQKVVFGSSKHRYRFDQPIGMTEVERFEKAYNVRLPLPYRRYITELGNGGAGPYYGILPLDIEAPQLHKEFPSTKTFQIDVDDDDVGESEIPGSIMIAEYGDGIFILLVIKGEGAGQVWVDARYEKGIAPYPDETSSRWTFDTWWLNIMREELSKFERILGMMMAGTEHEEIHKALDPEILQLEVDTFMLSIMDKNPNAKPTSYANKPWGSECGLVEDHYSQWLREDRYRTKHSQ